MKELKIEPTLWKEFWDEIPPFNSYILVADHEWNLGLCFWTHSGRIRRIDRGPAMGFGVKWQKINISQTFPGSFILQDGTLIKTEDLYDHEEITLCEN